MFFRGNLQFIKKVTFQLEIFKIIFAHGVHEEVKFWVHNVYYLIIVFWGFFGCNRIQQMQVNKFFGVTPIIKKVKSICEIVSFIPHVLLVSSCSTNKFVTFRDLHHDICCKLQHLSNHFFCNTSKHKFLTISSIFGSACIR